MDDLHIVTVATESKYYFPYLVESCKRNGKELEVLGYGEKWKGFNMKYKQMIEYLRKLPEKDIVCFVDGYDVLCVRDLSELKKEFLEIREKTGCKMVVSEDIHQFSLMKFFTFLTCGKCNNISINSGMYIGYAPDLLKILEEMIKINDKDDADDQLLLTQYCNQSKNSVYIDSEQQLFLTICTPLTELDQYVEVSETTKKVSYHSSHPFFVHANFYGYLDGLIQKLGYSIEPNKIKNELFNHLFIKKVCLYPYMLIKNHLLFFILLILVIIILVVVVRNHKKIPKLLKLLKPWRR
jgi:hypothetical protein